MRPAWSGDAAGKMQVGGGVGRGGRNSRPVPHRAISRVTIKAPVFLTQFLRQNSGREEEEGAACVTRVPARAVVACTLVQGHAGACVLGDTHVHVHTCSSVHTRVHSPHKGQARRTKPPQAPRAGAEPCCRGEAKALQHSPGFIFAFA